MAFKGALAGCRPWTAAELDATRARYVSDGAPALAREFGRTVRAVNHKAQRIGVLTRRIWTRQENALVRDQWGEISLNAVAKRLGRRPAAVYRHATRVLGLQGGCPEGYETLSEAARRTGFDTDPLRRLLERAGVRLRKGMSVPAKTKKRMRVVDPMDVDDAVTAWVESEPLGTAAAARGLGRCVLERILRDYGKNVPPKPTGARAVWRIPSRIIDAAVAARAAARGELQEAAA